MSTEQMPLGYKVQPASCGAGYFAMRERYDGAWQALRDDKRQPIRYPTPQAAVIACMVDAARQGPTDIRQNVAHVRQIRDSLKE